MTIEADTTTVYDQEFVEWAVECMGEVAEHIREEHPDGEAEFRTSLAGALNDARIAGATTEGQAAVWVAAYLLNDELSDKGAHDIAMLAYALGAE